MLDGVADVLASEPSLNVEIQGYTDNRGSLSFNTKLSQARAKAVMNFLIERGISANRLTATGYGPSDPVDSNDTARGRANNRRVELSPSQR